VWEFLFFFAVDGNRHRRNHSGNKQRRQQQHLQQSPGHFNTTTEYPFLFLVRFSIQVVAAEGSDHAAQPTPQVGKMNDNRPPSSPRPSRRRFVSLATCITLLVGGGLHTATVVLLLQSSQWVADAYYQPPPPLKLDIPGVTTLKDTTTTTTTTTAASSRSTTTSSSSSTSSFPRDFVPFSPSPAPPKSDTAQQATGTPTPPPTMSASYGFRSPIFTDNNSQHPKGKGPPQQGHTTISSASSRTVRAASHFETAPTRHDHANPQGLQSSMFSFPHPSKNVIHQTASFPKARIKAVILGQCGPPSPSVVPRHDIRNYPTSRSTSHIPTNPLTTSISSANKYTDSCHPNNSDMVFDANKSLGDSTSHDVRTTSTCTVELSVLKSQNPLFQLLQKKITEVKKTQNDSSCCYTTTIPENKTEQTMSSASTTEPTRSSSSDMSSSRTNPLFQFMLQKMAAESSVLKTQNPLFQLLQKKITEVKKTQNDPSCCYTTTIPENKTEQAMKTANKTEQTKSSSDMSSSRTNPLFQFMRQKMAAESSLSSSLSLSSITTSKSVLSYSSRETIAPSGGEWEAPEPTYHGCLDGTTTHQQGDTTVELSRQQSFSVEPSTKEKSQPFGAIPVVGQEDNKRFDDGKILPVDNHQVSERTEKIPTSTVEYRPKYQSRHHSDDPDSIHSSLFAQFHSVITEVPTSGRRSVHIASTNPVNPVLEREEDTQELDQGNSFPVNSQAVRLQDRVLERSSRVPILVVGRRPNDLHPDKDSIHSSLFAQFHSVITDAPPASTRRKSGVYAAAAASLTCPPDPPKRSSPQAPMTVHETSSIFATKGPTTSTSSSVNTTPERRAMELMALQQDCLEELSKLQRDKTSLENVGTITDNNNDTTVIRATIKNTFDSTHPAASQILLDPYLQESQSEARVDGHTAPRLEGGMEELPEGQVGDSDADDIDEFVPNEMEKVHVENDAFVPKIELVPMCEWKRNSYSPENPKHRIILLQPEVSNNDWEEESVIERPPSQQPETATAEGLVSSKICTSYPAASVSEATENATDLPLILTKLDSLGSTHAAAIEVGATTRHGLLHAGSAVVPHDFVNRENLSEVNSSEKIADCASTLKFKKKEEELSGVVPDMTMPQADNGLWQRTFERYNEKDDAPKGIGKIEDLRDGTIPIDGSTNIQLSTSSPAEECERGDATTRRVELHRNVINEERSRTLGSVEASTPARKTTKEMEGELVSWISSHAKTNDPSFKVKGPYKFGVMDALHVTLNRELRCNEASISTKAGTAKQVQWNLASWLSSHTITKEKFDPSFSRDVGTGHAIKNLPRSNALEGEDASVSEKEKTITQMQWSLASWLSSHAKTKGKHDLSCSVMAASRDGKMDKLHGALNRELDSAEASISARVETAKQVQWSLTSWLASHTKSQDTKDPSFRVKLGSRHAVADPFHGSLNRARDCAEASMSALAKTVYHVQGELASWLSSHTTTKEKCDPSFSLDVAAWYDFKNKLHGTLNRELECEAPSTSTKEKSFKEVEENLASWLARHTKSKETDSTSFSVKEATCHSVTDQQLHETMQKELECIAKASKQKTPKPMGEDLVSLLTRHTKTKEELIGSFCARRDIVVDQLHGKQDRAWESDQASIAMKEKTAKELKVNLASWLASHTKTKENYDPAFSAKAATQYGATAPLLEIQNRELEGVDDSTSPWQKVQWNLASWLASPTKTKEKFDPSFSGNTLVYQTVFANPLHGVSIATKENAAKGLKEVLASWLVTHTKTKENIDLSFSAKVGAQYSATGSFLAKRNSERKFVEVSTKQKTDKEPEANLASWLTCHTKSREKLDPAFSFKEALEQADKNQSRGALDGELKYEEASIAGKEKSDKRMEEKLTSWLSSLTKAHETLAASFSVQTATRHSAGYQLSKKLECVVEAPTLAEQKAVKEMEGNLTSWLFTHTQNAGNY
jgi:hemerythrin